MFCSDNVGREVLVQHFDVLFNPVGTLDLLFDRVPTRLCVFALVKDVEQFFSLSGIEIKTVTPHKLQRVPLPWIVTRSDCNAAVRLQSLHGELHAGRWANTEI